MMAPEDRKPANRTVRAAMQKLVDLQRAGLTHLPKPRRASQATAEDQAAPAPAASCAAAPPSPTHPAVDRAAALAEVERRVAVCTRCPELARTRTRTVFGDGNPHARLVFLGEAPGADEDLQGIPFVGRAGQLLTDIIVKGMGLRREDVYILNPIKCRPPDNRTPDPAEIANCREYLDQQLAIIQPQYICCLGAVAAQTLFGAGTAIGRMRGRVHDWQGIKVLCTYHPAYLLRTPSAKRQVWEDIQILMADMGLPAPKKSGP
jgi:uracil-DNA glycosylase family 4